MITQDQAFKAKTQHEFFMERMRGSVNLQCLRVILLLHEKPKI